MKKFSLIFISLVLFISLQAQEIVIPLYNGVAPGSEQWSWKETEKVYAPGSRAVYNVSEPTLTLFLPDKAIANGTAIVVCPGGGFHFLAIDKEGYDVAKWLNNKGITVFVLKYRLAQSFTEDPVKEYREKYSQGESFRKSIETIIPLDVADGRAAVAYVRANAEKFGIVANRIGIMGFSAGGTVAAGVAFTYDQKSRPDFAAPIYPFVGGFGDPAVPADAPPIFIAGTSDDPYGFHKQWTTLSEKWTDAKKSAELHIYKNGGHGFGVTKKNLPTDGWIERFYEWYLGLAL